MFFRWASASVILLWIMETAAQNSGTFICSTENSADSSFAAIFQMYQSRGACGTSCGSSGYAFAILQGSECWCSNYFPQTTVSSTLCNTPCPGYNTDNCGGTFNGAFAYYQLAQASGTRIASSAVASTSRDSTPTTTQTTQSQQISSTSSSTRSSQAPVTVVVTETASARPVSQSTSSTTTPTSRTSTTATTNPSTSTKASSSRSATAVATSNESQSSLQQQNSNGFFSSPGKVAGTFVAVGLIAAFAIGALLFFCLRRRNQHRATSSLGGAALNRKGSSSSTVEEQSAASNDGRSRSGSSPRLNGLGREKVGQGRISPHAVNWPVAGAEILPVDQRLDPRPMLMRFDSNYSRHSLRDEEDYSRRVLTVTNPETP